MTTPNERRIRAGYELFLAADPKKDEDWTPGSPVAALMAENIVWIDHTVPAADDSGGPRRYPGKGSGQDEANLSNPTTALGRLRQLRQQMPCCQILSCLEDKDQATVHTVDHGLKSDDGGKRPLLCASSFKFDEDLRQVVEVVYCATEMFLDLPGQSGS